mgnify:CR=1 FL=1
MKKFRTMMAMMLALVGMCVAFSSCGDDDDDNTTAASVQEIVGTYVGDMTTKVSTSESTSENVEFKIEKVDDTHVNVILPAFGEAPMALPSITVKNLAVTASDGTYTIPQTAFDQTLENGKKISNTAIAATVKDGKMHIQFAMQYGNMPFTMNCSSDATKK